MSEQVNLQEALVKKAAFGNDIDLEKFDDNNEAAAAAGIDEYRRRR